MITHIIPRLPAKNLDETEAFYHRVLGFSTLNRYPDYLLLELGGLEIHFYAHPDTDPATSDVSLYLRVEGNLEALFQKAVAEQATFPAGAHIVDQPWQMREFAITDPNGGLLTFGEEVE